MSNLRDTFIGTFWLGALALILVFLFFVLLGAIDPGETAGLSALIGALAVLWIYHALRDMRDRGAARDLASVRARERRGF